MKRSDLAIIDLSCQALHSYLPDHWHLFEDAWGAFEDETCVAIAGYLEWDGRLWVSFDVLKGGTEFGAAMVRALRRGLNVHNRTCCVQCDDVEMPKAKRLLTLLGFTPTNDFYPDARAGEQPLRIWTWEWQQHC